MAFKESPGFVPWIFASLGWQKKTPLLQCQDAARLTTVLRKWVVGHHPCEMLGSLDCTRKWE